MNREQPQLETEKIIYIKDVWNGNSVYEAVFIQKLSDDEMLVKRGNRYGIIDETSIVDKEEYNKFITERIQKVIRDMQDIVVLYGISLDNFDIKYIDDSLSISNKDI